MKYYFRMILISVSMVIIFFACGRIIEKGSSNNVTTNTSNSSTDSKTAKKSKEYEILSSGVPTMVMADQTDANEKKTKDKSKKPEVNFEIPADIERNFPNQLATDKSEEKSKNSNTKIEKETTRNLDQLKNDKKQTEEQKVINNPKKGVEPHFKICDEKEMPILRLTDTRFIDEKYPTISADGKLIVYEGWFKAESGESAPLALFSMVLDQSLKKNVLVKGSFINVRPFLHPSSKEVFFATNSFENQFHAASMTLDGSGSINLNYRKYCNDVLDITISTQQIVAISYLKVGKTLPSVGLVNSDGTFYPEVVDGSEVAWSSNGERFLFVNNNGNYLDIFSAKADGSDVVQLTTHFGICHHPSYSPDGEFVVFSAITEVNKKYDLFLMNKDGKNIEQITSANENDRNPVWGKDGWIYFETERFDNNSEIAKIDSNALLKKFLDKKKAPDFLK